MRRRRNAALIVGLIVMFIGFFFQVRATWFHIRMPVYGIGLEVFAWTFLLAFLYDRWAGNHARKARRTSPAPRPRPMPTGAIRSAREAQQRASAATETPPSVKSRQTSASTVKEPPSIAYYDFVVDKDRYAHDEWKGPEEKDKN